MMKPSSGARTRVVAKVWSGSGGIRRSIIAMGKQGMDATSALPKIQQYLRKMKRHGRHVPKILRYGTPKKIANITLA
jgi:hypothetical protein